MDFMDDTGKIIRRNPKDFCQTFSLNTWESKKGADNGYFKTVIFDEVVTRKFYLQDEFIIFCNLLSSILRGLSLIFVFSVDNFSFNDGSGLNLSKIFF